MLDCPGNHSSNWESSTSSDQRELLCLGCCSRHCNTWIYPAFNLADELERFGIGSIGRNSWHTHGGLPSIAGPLGQMKTDASDRNSYSPPAFQVTHPPLRP